MVQRSLAAVLIGIAFAIGFLVGGADPETDSQVPLFETRTFYEETEGYIAEARWPTIRNQAVSGQIEAFVTSTLAEFRTLIADDRPAYPGIKNSLSVSWNYAYITDHLASLRFSIVTYAGGAHGNQVIEGKNYSLPEGRELSLADMFVPGAPYLARISETVREVLRERLGEGFFEDGAAARAENFESFTLAADRIMFHFSPYDVAAYASGPQQVEIPLAALADILR